MQNGVKRYSILAQEQVEVWGNDGKMIMSFSKIGEKIVRVNYS